MLTSGTLVIGGRDGGRKGTDHSASQGVQEPEIVISSSHNLSKGITMISDPSEGHKGSLYLVATPIGNLEDITYRAVKVLSLVDLIAAEDTRTTKVLLDHYGISKPMVSYFSYNEHRRTPQLIEKLLLGQSIALVSDAGTPGISDPAFHIVQTALASGITDRADSGSVGIRFCADRQRPANRPICLRRVPPREKREEDETGSSPF